MEVTGAAVHWLDWGLWRQPRLAERLGVPVSVTAGIWPCSDGSAYVGWGLKASGRRARRLANRHARPCWLLEDGFLRSLGGNSSPSCSIVIDDEGIYYDASRPSRLERLIGAPLPAHKVERTRRLIQSWQDGLVSKYNHARDVDVSTLPSRYVLVVDQTAKDAAIVGGQADARTFQTMLDEALAAHPDCHVVLKVHPEVARGRKAGHFDIEALARRARLHVIAGETHPAVLLAHAVAVYTVTSQLGFEALLWKKPVHVYGMPFYAGWGLTHDRQPTPARRQPASLEQLAHAALVDYPRYFDPETSQPCEVEAVLTWLAMQRRQRGRFAPRVLAYGFSKWKQGFVRDFLAGSDVTFTDQLPPWRPDSDPLVTWGHKHAAELDVQGHGDKVLRIEDGFLRSVGLGADLIRPLSWVTDAVGIYYDAQRPSELEQLLARTVFDPDLVARASRLRALLVEQGITKYNLVRPTRWQRPSGVTRVVLVPGQVETDAAIKYGSTGVARNIDLLKAARQACPDAWVVYKPHPDVLAGLRNQGDRESQARQWCDEIIGDIPFDTLLEKVDEVHVLSSLAGFEALLRGVPVVTWGQPFYAGWGLTQDHGLSAGTAARRGRQLTIDELVAATLILYPTYVSRKTRQFCTVERALQELLEWRRERHHHPLRRLVAKIFRKP